MSWLVLLDAGPLGLVTNPKGSDESRRCSAGTALAAAHPASVLLIGIARLCPGPMI